MKPLSDYLMSPPQKRIEGARNALALFQRVQARQTSKSET